MITGSIVALITPMKFGSCEIDWESLEKLIDWHYQNQTDAIVVVGTTGESSTLSFAEHKKVIEQAVKYSSGKIPIIAGTGANSTAEAIELTRSASEAGADACLLVTPYYNKPSQEGLFRHYEEIAKKVSINQILYNVPSRTACDLHSETVIRLSKLENIVGIKEATGDLNRLIFMKKHCDDNFAFYSGDDETACEFILNGGHGDISVTANLDPGRMYRLCNAALNGDVDLARKINCELEKLHKILFVESNPIPVKYAASCLGLTENVLRLPLTCITESKQNDIKLELNRLNLKGLTY